MGKREEIVEIALSQKGYKEGPNNDTKYGEWYGLNYNPWCFKAGTLILTPKGERNIEDIQIGDKVISSDGSIESVYNNNKRNVDEIVTIKVNGNIPIDTTKEHPFLCKKRQGNNFLDAEYIPAEQISKGDRVALYKGTFGNKKVYSPLAYLIGRFIGDGWVTMHHNKKEFFICCSYEEAEELEQKMKDANISYNKDKAKRTCQQYSINKTNKKGKDLNNELFASILGNIKTGAKNKKVPEDVWNWDEESTKAFLDGYLDADGSDTGDLLINFTTVSKELLIGISNLFRKFGYNINCSIRHRDEDIICGRKVKVNDAYWGYCTGRESDFYEDDGEYIWVLIKDIKIKKEKTYVYNLSVNNTHTFIANGFVVHNCAMFVSWCANETGIGEDIIPKFAGCTTGFRLMTNMGITTKEHIVPQKGDLIFFDWDRSGDYDHVGIVTDANESSVWTVEGNHDDNVDTYVYPIDASYIAGYARPKYEDEPSPEPPKPTPGYEQYVYDYQVAWNKTYGDKYGRILEDGIFGSQTEWSKTKVYLKRGMKNHLVGWCQCRLKYHKGYDLGNYGVNHDGVDDDFGSMTASVVGQFQRDNGLEADEIIGYDTISILF